MMTQHGAAIAQVEDEKYPEFDAITADFVYARCAAVPKTSQPAIRRKR